MVPRIRASAVRSTYSQATYVCRNCRYSTHVEASSSPIDISTRDAEVDIANALESKDGTISSVKSRVNPCEKAFARYSEAKEAQETKTLKSIARNQVNVEFQKRLSKLKTPEPSFIVREAEKDKWVVQAEFQGKAFTSAVAESIRHAKTLLRLAIIDHLEGLKPGTTRAQISGDTAPKLSATPSTRKTRVVRRLARPQLEQSPVRISRVLSRTPEQNIEPSVGRRNAASLSTKRGGVAGAPRGKIYKPKDLASSKNAKTFAPTSLRQSAVDIPHAEIPGLSYGLDRVLFNPGVYHLQDPRSRVYNFDPSLSQIIEPAKFNYGALDEYRSPSNDNTLSTVAKEHDAKFFSSTSAVTSVLQHLHFLLSKWRPLNFDMLSKGFERTNSNTDSSNHSRGPTSIYLLPKEGGYALDKAGSNSSSVLSFMGQCLEKLLTVPKEEFESYHVGSDLEIPKPAPHGYHYTKFGNMLVRSQLDAYDDRLPGTGIFDIKTRAVLPLRMDSLEHSNKDFKNYEIKTQQGEFESFEREFYDMARATMMKYSLQARLGRMDGIFVAYHNIARMFGFQYLSLEDMDEVLHGQRDTTMGDSELYASLRILTDALDYATKKFPGEPLRLYFETRERQVPFTYVFVVPVTEEEITQRHIDGQRQAQEYLEKMVKAANEDSVLDDGESSILELEDVASEEDDASTKFAKDIEDPDEENPEESLEETAKIAESDINDEINRLQSVTDKLFKDHTYLNLLTENIPTDTHKRLVTELANGTIQLGKEVNKIRHLVETLEEDKEYHQQRITKLQESVDEQSKLNYSLLMNSAFDEQDVESIAALKEGQLLDVDGEPARSLEEMLKGEKESRVPARYAAFSIIAQSTVNGKLLEGPPKVKGKDKWEVTYAFEDIEDEELLKSQFVAMAKRHDEASMTNWNKRKLKQYYEGWFYRNLQKLSEEGKKYREGMDRRDREKGVVVFEARG